MGSKNLDFIKQLKESFRINGLPYTLLKRNEYVAFYGIGGTYADEILHYEVDIIYIRKDKYGEREAIADNENFGRDRSRCYSRNSKQKALDYFDKLTAELAKERNLSLGVPKSITGVEQDAEVVSAYSLV